ncbi:MAG: hypothetical protein IKA41_06090 [Bacteroidaceae bacterium]|nr:hypothetical protein [Bacteroidaceae bacterium]
MKKVLFMFAALLLATFSVSADNNEVEKMLKKIDAVTSYELLEKNDTTRTYYLLKYRQNLDPKNIEAGTFEQRVMLGHRGFDRPTVIVTEGYGADYAFKNKRFGVEELAFILNANILFTRRERPALRQ